MKKFFTTLTLIFGFASVSHLYGQDPSLPSVNLGLTNLQVGVGKPPGWYYVQYLQVYHAGKFYDQHGQPVTGDHGYSSVTSLQQVVYRSDIEIFNGRLGASMLMPLTLRTGPSTLTVNPGLVGDLLAGPFIEWLYKVGRRPLHFRFGINGVFPTGAYSNRYDINPSANRFRIFPHVELTYRPTDRLAISVKDNFYVFFREPGKPERSAPANSINYAVEYRVLARLTLAAVGYNLNQTGQDSYNGDKNYYANYQGLEDTREKVAGAGPGIAYKTLSGIFIEVKGMWEFAAVNRTQGFRSTVVLSFAL